MATRRDRAACEAYDNVTGQLRRYLGANNKMMEIATWTDVQATIDPSASTFQLEVRRLDKAPLMLPPTGRGWQLVGGEWARRPVSDVLANGVCQSPSLIDGHLVISYRWTWGSWLTAQIYWMWRMMLRFLGWLVILGLLFLAVWIFMRVPWRGVAAAIGSVLSRAAQTTPIGQQQPTSTPRPARAGYQGRPPNVSPK